MRRFLTVGFLLVFVGCAEKPIRPLVSSPLAHAVRTQEIIDLAAVTDFDWDTVYIFPPYTPASEVKKKVGRFVPSSIEASDSVVLLVFLHRGRVVRFADFERQIGDLSSASGTDGIPRSKAKFRKFVAADGRVMLENA